MLISILTLRGCVYFYACFDYTPKLTTRLKSHCVYGNISKPVAFMAYFWVLRTPSPDTFTKETY
jgi:hypothetical protein